MQERVQRKGHFPILLVGMLIGTLWRFLKKLKIELPYDPAIPLLGTYLENMKISMGKDTCTPVFIAALFTTAKTRKQPKCPSTEEWIKKLWYIYTRECYSVIKKNKIMPFTPTRMDLETIILNEILEKKKCSMILLICEI